MNESALMKSEESIMITSGRKQMFVAIGIALLASMGLVAAAGAQELTPEEEMARKAQDPLGDIRALMTDNTIAFGGGESEDDITYGFQLQPV
jgi:hypothetical protein